MKLTALELDMAIVRDRQQDIIQVARFRNNGDETIVVGTRSALAHLPRLDLPQPTEPFFIGDDFRRAAPPRPRVSGKTFGDVLFAIALGLVSALLLFGALSK